MAKHKKTKAFPELLFVTLAGEGEGVYYEADETIRSKEHGEQVAIYELREVQTKRVTHELK